MGSPGGVHTRHLKAASCGFSPESTFGPSQGPSPGCVPRSSLGAWTVPTCQPLCDSHTARITSHPGLATEPTGPQGSHWAALIKYGWWTSLCEEIRVQAGTEGQPREDTEGRTAASQPPTRQEQKPQEKPAPSTSPSWTSSLQNQKKAGKCH